MLRIGLFFNIPFTNGLEGGSIFQLFTFVLTATAIK
jgi:hypothetical protein